MSQNEAFSVPVTINQTPPVNRWLRVSAAQTDALAVIKQRLGIDLIQTVTSGISQVGEFLIYPLTFLSVEGNKKIISKVIFIVGREILVSLEPEPAPKPLGVAVSRMQRDGRDNDAFDAFAIVLQSINDATDELLDSLNEDLGEALVQTNAVLNSLESRERDFGVSDVVSTQVELGVVEDLLSECIQTQLQLALVARQTLARLPQEFSHLRQRYHTLIDDIEGVEEHVHFVHDRVRLLQTSNNLALSVKQNQIVKVFSVLTAVFLPALLISTYYSMNFAYMPILEWQYGEPMVIALTALLTLLPLIYVKQRGLLR
ncbi:MAG: CorA family divalent cation transporter [Roseiflexus sp.]|jgi:magnesium transporter|nr:CorA family divalent cation transporter [Roseiflexus sp.]MBO9366984.1 CorA family divalent cation transporter [Roseiflexus sp.]